jgi:microcystin-dependent protein
MFAGNFAPRGYMLCQGQLLPISQYAALFSILGTTFGGNGTTNFALPDLQGRLPVGWGNGAGLTPVVLGQKAGVDNVTILTSNMPAHNHLIGVNNQPGNAVDPTGHIQAIVNDGAQPSPTTYVGYTTATATGTMAANSVSLTGSGIPLNIQNPYLGLTFIIATEGIFPSRN